MKNYPTAKFCKHGMGIGGDLTCIDCGPKRKGVHEVAWDKKQKAYVGPLPGQEMPEYLIRANEGCAPDPFLLWDSVHQDVEGGTDFVCDWLLAAPGANNLNVGGLQAIAELGTAVYLMLFTDAYLSAEPSAGLSRRRRQSRLVGRRRRRAHGSG